MHFVIGSFDKIVGTCKISAQEFMKCSADKAGVRRVRILFLGGRNPLILLCSTDFLQLRR
jgi:hypothetical protein